VRMMQARDDEPAELAGQLWDLPSWARTGNRLLADMSGATDVPPVSWLPPRWCAIC